MRNEASRRGGRRLRALRDRRIGHRSRQHGGPEPTPPTDHHDRRADRSLDTQSTVGSLP